MIIALSLLPSKGLPLGMQSSGNVVLNGPANNAAPGGGSVAGPAGPGTKTAPPPPPPPPNKWYTGNVSRDYGGSSYIAQVVYNGDGSIYMPPAGANAADAEYAAWLNADSWNKAQQAMIDAKKQNTPGGGTATTGAGTSPAGTNTTVVTPGVTTDPFTLQSQTYQPQQNYAPGMYGGGGGGGGGGAATDFSYQMPTTDSTTAAPPTWWQKNKKYVIIGIAVVVVIVVIWKRKVIFGDVKKVAKKL
jgi:hypothetical protein